LEIYEEQLYKEVVYDARPGDYPEEHEQMLNPLKAGKASTIRNVDKIAKEAFAAANPPEHPKKIATVRTPHEEFKDPYEWLRRASKDEEREFVNEEHEFTNMCLFRYDYLMKTMLREQEFYAPAENQVMPLSMGDYLYYRRINNPADSLSLYRYSLDLLEEDTDNPVDFSSPPLPGKHEECVFSMADLVEFYSSFALRDERIKKFVERITEFVELGTHQPLHSFQVSNDAAAIVFDTERNGKALDIIVKDLRINKLLPLLILNSDGEVAFDKLDGFYYT